MLKSLEIIETPFGNFIIDEYDLIGSCIKNYKVWEYHLYEIYSKIITKDYYCVDIGANIGFHSIQFGNLGKKVYAFEPQRYVFNQLSTNILFNNLDNVIDSYRLGLGAKTETQQLWNIEHENWVGNGAHNWGGRGVIQSNLDPKKANENVFREEDIINIISLDSLDIYKCDFIKIDVQGYEYNTFVGAENTLDKFKPIIFLENHIGDSENELKAKQYLIDKNYEFYRLDIGNHEDCIAIHPQNPEYNKHIDIINSFKIKYNINREN